MRTRLIGLLSVPLAAVLLGGCTPGHEDLREWMAQQQRQMVPKVTPISEPKQFVPLAYTQSDAADPFSAERLTQALRRESGVGGSGAALIAPELNRRKEPLEAYPLDVMAMLGSLDRGGQRVALVRVDKLLYQVRVGDYLGQNYGKVMQISEAGVGLREIVQDAAGEWIERNAELQLQEKKQ
ncbi:MAG TPA: pilus assembly protein PilP [Ottowia sp.]|uniref:pilus assembly protein PilP n=1 Tax=Ottowia sp. TaxID=1898956 RepID=UPI002BF259EF|nr:pilus assembly protein PilP [Ottowia sp.]HMN20337.1 pilus assembly protein PilP [Ottowia sp.]